MSLQWSPPRMLPPSLAWPLFGMVVLLNLIMKGLWIGAQDIALDEPFTIFWAQHPLSDIWEVTSNGDNPPLHFVLEHFWIKLFGIGPVSVRFPSLIFSCITAGVLFRIGNRHFGWVPGLGAALLYSLSTEHIFFSHEARAYALLCMLTALALERYLRILHDPQSWANMTWLAFWNSLMIYTHFLGFWVLLAELACAVLLLDKRKALPRLAAMFVALGLAYAPSIPAILARLQSVKAAGGTWVEKPHWSQLYGHINLFLNGKWGTVGLILVLAAGVFFLFAQRRGREWMGSLLQRREMLVVLGFFGLMYFGMFFQSLVFSPTFIPRYLIFTSVPLFMALGNLGNWLMPGKPATAAAVGVVGFFMLFGLDANPSNHREMKQLAETVAGEKQVGTPLIICPGYADLAFLYHYDRAMFQDWANLEEAMQARRIYPVSSWKEIPTSVMDSANKVVFLDADAKFTLPENGVLPALQTRFPNSQKHHVEQIFDVHVFQR